MKEKTGLHLPFEGKRVPTLSKGTNERNKESPHFYRVNRGGEGKTSSRPGGKKNLGEKRCVGKTCPKKRSIDRKKGEKDEGKEREYFMEKKCLQGSLQGEKN